MQYHKKLAAAAAALIGIITAGAALAQPPAGPMSFFLTSTGSGDGGNLGGLEGADRICQDLAQAAGHGSSTWRAYLSTQGPNAVNARDRIGPGPWFNVRGARIAADAEELHSTANRLAVFTALDERGNQIPGSGFSPNRHDILTGSQPDGTAYPAGADMTCNNWTSTSDEGGAKARVGHHDYANWNSTHDSRGCSQEALIGTGGDGLFYCFALPAE
ncbi:MAG TPA: lectin [Gammaproteobacteria bacterium]|nr:lectin [Gammaproteobacteria bacterium]